MAVATKNKIRYANAAITRKVKMGGTKVVSRALVKQGVTNLVPKMHVRQGDMVMLISGARKDRKWKDAEMKDRANERNAFVGTTGKVLSVFPEEGKIVVEGVNIVTRATKSRNPMAKSGQIKGEGKIFASKVMLFCTACKKPTRIQHKTLENGTKVRSCKKCKETF